MNIRQIDNLNLGVLLAAARMRGCDAVARAIMREQTRRVVEEQRRRRYGPGAGVAA